MSTRPSNDTYVHAPQTSINPNIDHTWEYDWDPNGGVHGAGRLTASLSGPGEGTQFIDLNAAQRKVGAKFNAFGLNGGFPTPPDSKPSEFADMFIDDVIYTVLKPLRVLPSTHRHNLLKGRFAKVRMVNAPKDGRFFPLRANAPVNLGARYLHWSKIPPEFKGLYFFKNNEQQGTTQFQITSSGTVLMAVTTRWAGGGGGSDWKRELVTQKDLESKGWRKVGRLGSYYKVGGSLQDWIVFARHCKKGESYSYRTEKYVAPVIMLKEPDAKIVQPEPD